MATPIPDNAAGFSADEIRGATAAALDGAGADVRGVCLDSRRVAPGNLFVALRGDNHDAHEFVPQAVERGAGAVIVDREMTGVGADVYRVEDTLTALGALAALHRSRSKAQVVAITGSVGKTSTKELTAAALRGAGREVHATEGNLNNRVGVPMTLFGIRPEHDAAVIEMGMSVPGEIAALTEMARPDVGVVTSVAEVHTEGVGGIAGVAREKGALLVGLSQDATAVYNRDDAPLLPYAERARAAKKLGYGTGEDADPRLVRWDMSEAGTRLEVSCEGRALSGELRLLGGGAALNATGALAVVAALAPDHLEPALAAMGKLAPRPQRMCPEAGPGGILVLDDSYNASPRSTVEAMRTGVALARARGGKLIAVLADMLELGHREAELHQDMGREAVRLGVGALVLHGERMSAAAKAAMMVASRGDGGMVPVRIIAEADAVAGCVRELAEPADVVLVKGSRGMRMERVVVALTEATP